MSNHSGSYSGGIRRNSIRQGRIGIKQIQQEKCTAMVSDVMIMLSERNGGPFVFPEAQTDHKVSDSSTLMC